DPEVTRSTALGSYWIEKVSSWGTAVFSLSGTGGNTGGRIIQTGRAPIIARFYSIPEYRTLQWGYGAQFGITVRARRSSAVSWSLVTTPSVTVSAFAWDGTSTPSPPEFLSGGGNARPFYNGPTVRINISSLELNTWRDYQSVGVLTTAPFTPTA